MNVPFACCLYASLDILLGHVASWAIGKTPKAFKWTIERICVRPSFSWHSWSEVAIIGWTWHNPRGFEDDEANYILQIDRLTLRCDLRSFYYAIRDHQSVVVDLLKIDGVRFKTQRNNDAALNLWEALDLPDNDLNVSVVMKKARESEHGIHSKAIMPLPPVATAATRQAAGYWRKSWRKEAPTTPTPTSQVMQPSTTTCSCLSFACWKAPPEEDPAAQTPKEYFEFAIGDKRRRPRWGVPVRFDIKMFLAEDVDVWIFDLLTMDRWESAPDRSKRFADPSQTKMSVRYLAITRETFEARDERRSGGGPLGDGIRGIYLGELVWGLIGELLPEVVRASPGGLLKNMLFASTYAARDSAMVVSGSMLDLALYAKGLLHLRRLPPVVASDACFLHVHLMRGRKVTHNGDRVNVHVRLSLKDAPEDHQESNVRA
jgi:hypothetical protein